eukprot:TRINITY_DN1135_c0_g1_i4.p1 TRINITY_DN1135_c0_g1~~TRINITY_DN1135_c0_g1_i4.p1  ORF type:complete len:149 (+),score=43.60 TRINITY_DN1135_c0_g1_i4:156-602(+)
MAGVVNVRKNMLVKSGYRDLAHWVEDPSHVYIGRDMTRYVPGAVGSKWGNPFPAKKHGREESIRLYAEHIQKSGYDLSELRGKVLGCWCKPEPCHGDTLMRLVREMDGAGDDVTDTTPPPSAPAEAPANAMGAPPPTKPKPKKKSRLQ